MAPGSRLQELTAKYMQNPRRYFVPLANEYRQANDLDRAIALCREHLPAQPGHMSGHIVLGRAYFEKGDIDAAREVFLTSVALDDENAIALRHLGDIARLRGQPSEARQWYARVLDADPENAEIERLLRSLGGSSPTPLSAAAVMPAAPLGSVPPPGGSLTTTLRPPSTFELADAAEALSDPTPPGLKAIFGELEPATAPDLDVAPSATSAHHGLEILDASDLDAASGTNEVAEEPLVIADGMGFRFDDLDELTDIPATGAFAAVEALPPVEDSDFSAGIETPPALRAILPVESPTDVPADTLALPDPVAVSPTAPVHPEPVAEAPSAPATAAAEDELLSRPAFGALASFASWRTARERETPAMGQPTISPTPLAQPVQPVEPEPYVDLAAGVLFDDDVQVDAAETAPEFVTETMAQLYVQQGFLSQALDVYRLLAERSPESPQFAAKVAELESALAPTAPAVDTVESVEAQLEADADTVLSFDDAHDDVDGPDAGTVSILELMYDAAPPTMDAVPSSRESEWAPAPAGVAGEDDWFADTASDVIGPDVGSGDESFYGISMDGFGATAEAEPFDAAVTAAGAPVTSLESLFGAGTVIAPADVLAGEILVALAGQMVGRLPKELPALPVPDVLDLPTTIPGEDGQAASPAPLLSFDRFFSGAGTPPRQRIDTPPAPAAPVPPRPTVPAQPSPSLSPTFGGVPVIPPPPPVTAQPWSNFDRSGTQDAAPRHTPAASAPIQVPEPEPVVRIDALRAADPTSAPLPSWMAMTPDVPLAAIPAEPVAPAPLPPVEPSVPEASEPTAAEEPQRNAPSEFHRWLEGLS